MSDLLPSLRDLASHLIEYPAGSGRLYHRHDDDGSVLRVEARLSDGWHDLTCDIVDVTIQWGDTNGDDLTPYSDAGQAHITLKDLDGRYGPLPPTGQPLFDRWVPVRVWVGHVTSATPVDTTTRYGTPGQYGSTPPAVYGGTARTVNVDAISCRFSGWLMSMERTPESGTTSAWTCGDGMVRLVDQKVRDYDLSTPPGTPVTDADWPPGLRENAPGNYRAQELVTQIHGPTGAPYRVVSHAAGTLPMMQSPGGLVGDLVHQVAQSDLAFFWWQPDVTAADHDTPADWFGYRKLDWFATHGLTWPIQCDGIHGYDGTLVSDDRNFYSAVRCAKGIPNRTVWWKQPPWSGFAFDSSVAKLVGGASFKVQPGEKYSFKSQMDLNCDKASVEFWFRITGPDLVKLGESTVQRSTTANPTVVTGGSSTIEVAPDTPPDTIIEMQVRGRSLSPITAPGHLADNVWLVVTRSGGEGPEVLVDDTTLADEREVHEYERKDLLLREQADVNAWAAWVVNRSSSARWMMESVSADPGQGAANWSWGMWHSAWLGDRVTLEIPDGGELHEEVQWIRGMEFHIADILTMTLHLETVPAGSSRRSLRTTVTGKAAGPSIPVAGGRIIPAYESRPELPGWTQNQGGNHLTIGSDGELTWDEGSGGVQWPIRTDQAPHGFVQLARRIDGVKGTPMEVSFFPDNAFNPAYNSNPYGDWSYLWCSTLGDFGLWNAEYFNQFVTGAYGANAKVWQYGDYRFKQGIISFENYTFADSDEPYDADSILSLEATTEGGFGEFFIQSGMTDIYLDYKASTGAYVPDVAYWLDATHYVQALPEPAARLRLERYDDGTGNARDLKVTRDWIGVCDGVSSLNAPPRRGCVSYLTHVDGTKTTASDPRVKQYQRQMGSTAVTFTSGVGTINVGVAMGTHRVPLAQVAGTTVGGPMVAQVSSTGSTITCYLSTTTTGTLTVNWSVEYEAVDWPAIVSVDVMSVGPTGSSAAYYNFLQPDRSESAIPYATTGSLALRIQGPNLGTTVAVHNSTGTAVGSVVAGGSESCVWTVAANAYTAGTGDWFHCVDGAGNTSNLFFVRWVTPIVFTPSTARSAPPDRLTPQERRAQRDAAEPDTTTWSRNRDHFVDEEGVVHARRAQRRHR